MTFSILLLPRQGYGEDLEAESMGTESDERLAFRRARKLAKVTKPGSWVKVYRHGTCFYSGQPTQRTVFVMQGKAA